MLLDRRAAPSFVVLTAIDLTPGPSGLRSGWSANSGDFRAAFFHPDCTVGPGMGLRLHRVVWLTPLAGFTADRGISPLPRRTNVNDSTWAGLGRGGAVPAAGTTFLLERRNAITSLTTACGYHLIQPIHSVFEEHGNTEVNYAAVDDVLLLALLA